MKNNSIEFINQEIRVNGMYAGYYKKLENGLFKTFFDTFHRSWKNVSSDTINGLKTAIFNQIN